MAELGSLVTRTQSGDLDAYGEIVRRFQDMAYGYSYSILGDFSAAEDAAQESFIQAYKELGSLREPEAFAGWFRRIVYTQCAMMARRNRVPTVSLDEVAEMPLAGGDPHELAEQSEMRDRVLDSIRALPENERVATALFYINGYSHDDIAGFLEVPLSTVKSRLHTARKRLKKGMIDMVSESLHSNKLPDDFGGRILAAIPPISSKQVNQFIAALTTVLNARDHAVSYDELMGLSGAAFRIHFWVPEWCPSSVDLLGGYQHHAPVLEALGYEYELYRDTAGNAWREAAVSCLDAGLPVIMENIDGTGRYAVIVGYVDGGRQWKARKWGNRSEELMLSTDHPWNTLVIGKRNEPMEPKQALYRSLEIALDLAHTQSYSRDDSPQASGFAAYEIWINALLRERSFDGVDAEVKEYYAHANEVIYTVLVDARASAARYLSLRTDILGPDARPRLLCAAELYREIAAVLQAVRSDVPSTMPEFQPNGLRDSSQWTSQMRRSQVLALRQAAELEHRAIGELKRALASK